MTKNGIILLILSLLSVCVFLFYLMLVGLGAIDSGTAATNSNFDYPPCRIYQREGGLYIPSGQTCSVHIQDDRGHEDAQTITCTVKRCL